MAGVRQESDEILANDIFQKLELFYFLLRFTEMRYHNSYIDGFKCFLVISTIKCVKFKECVQFLTDPYYLATIMIR